MKDWRCKNGVCSIFPQGLSDKIKDTRFYYDKCWGYILLFPLFNASLSLQNESFSIEKKEKKTPGTILYNFMRFLS